MAAVLAGVAVVGCGGGDGGAASEPTDTVTIQDFEYAPPSATVRAGTEVTFANEDVAAHTASSDQTGVFDTGGVERGQEATVTVDEPGTYSYICEFHPQMKGTLVVE